MGFNRRQYVYCLQLQWRCVDELGSWQQSYGCNHHWNSWHDRMGHGWCLSADHWCWPGSYIHDISSHENHLCDCNSDRSDLVSLWCQHGRHHCSYRHLRHLDFRGSVTHCSESICNDSRWYRSFIQPCERVNHPSSLYRYRHS